MQTCQAVRKFCLSKRAHCMHLESLLSWHCGQPQPSMPSPHAEPRQLQAPWHLYFCPELLPGAESSSAFRVARYGSRSLPSRMVKGVPLPTRATAVFSALSSSSVTLALKACAWHHLQHYMRAAPLSLWYREQTDPAAPADYNT